MSTRLLTARTIPPPLRYRVRGALASLSRYAPGTRPDILLFSARRGGSTWLMELIAIEPSVKFVNEPFHPDVLRARQLPTDLESALPWNMRKVVDVPPEREALYRNHLSRDRHTRPRGPFNPRSPQHNWRYQSRVIKVVNAIAIGEWIADQFPDSPVIYLIRHPIPSALSTMRTRLLMAEAYLHNPTFGEKHLSAEQRRLAWEIVHDGSDFERAVLEWSLDNLVPWRAVMSGRRSWSIMTYERLVTAPVAELERLAEMLQLSALERMIEHLHEPSASTAPGQRERIRSDEGAERIGRWRREVTASDEQSAFAIARAFGIDAYQPGSDIATALPGQQLRA